MENTVLYNLQHLIKVNYKNPYECDHYRFSPERKTWFGKIVPAHYWGTFLPNRTEEELIQKGFIIKNNVAYYPYCITLYFNNDHKKVFEFNNEKDALLEYEAILGLCDSENISLNNFKE